MARKGQWSAEMVVTAWSDRDAASAAWSLATRNGDSAWRPRSVRRCGICGAKDLKRNSTLIRLILSRAGGQSLDSLFRSWYCPFRYWHQMKTIAGEHSREDKSIRMLECGDHPSHVNY